MFTPALLNFVRSQRQIGVSDEDLRKQLLSAGWQVSVIEAAMKGLGDSAQFVRGVVPEGEKAGSVHADSDGVTESTGIFQGTAQPETKQESILIGETTDALTAGTNVGPLTTAGFPPDTIKLSPPPSGLDDQSKHETSLKADLGEAVSTDSEQPRTNKSGILKLLFFALLILLLLIGGIVLAGVTGYLSIDSVLDLR